MSDAAGATIFGSAPFARPITITSTDPVNGRISAAQLTNAQVPESVVYSGAPVHQIGIMSSVPVAPPTPLALAPSYGRESVLYAFSQTDGAYPANALAIDSTGALWGTTTFGGAYCEQTDHPESVTGCGVAFKLAPSGSSDRQSFLFSFNGVDGFGPQGPLLAGTGGTMYGVIGYTVPISGGYVYAFTPNGSGYSKSTLYAFAGGVNGAYPDGGLIADRRGALYGVTAYGGIGAVAGSVDSGDGTVYKLTPGKLGYSASILYRFGAVPKDGLNPYGELTPDASGSLYGLTGKGGSAAGGTLFKLSPTTTGYRETTLFNFNDGFPLDGIVISKSGVIYAAINHRGAFNAPGSVVALTPTPAGYVESTIYAFTDGLDGGYPQGGLVADAAGSLYGTAFYGGFSSINDNYLGNGVVFELARTGSGYRYVVLHRFDENNDGSQPNGTLLLDSTGTLYGVTQKNGVSPANFCYYASTGVITGCGSVFKVQTIGPASLGPAVQRQRR